MTNELLKPRRSIVDLERALQKPLDSTAISKTTLYRDVVRANANITPIPPAINDHLTDSPIADSIQPKSLNLKEVCSHGMKMISSMID